VSSLAYAYGDGINLTGITDGVTAANSNVLSYTPTNRLATATGNFGSSTYSYDGVGNRVSDVNTLSAVTKTRAFTTPTTSNRLSTITENAAAFRSYTYDGAGNILTDVRPGETFAFTYNKRNRPVSVTRNSVAYATYGYNALEQLTTRSTTAAGGPVGQVAYIYDLEGHLIAEATASTGVTTRDYMWMASNDNTPVDLPLAVADIVTTTSTLFIVHTDHLGRPIRMTDAAKATVWQATYKPFGEVQTTSGTKANNTRFPGQYFQIETAYAYNGYRHYDPVSGRYAQPDPLRFVNGPSIYAYAMNSPWMNTDRSGLEVGATGGLNYEPPSDSSSGSVCVANWIGPNPQSLGGQEGPPSSKIGDNPGAYAGAGAAVALPGYAGGGSSLGADAGEATSRALTGLAEIASAPAVILSLPFLVLMNSPAGTPNFCEVCTVNSQQTKTPNEGVPGSTVVNPGSGQTRTYGPDGKPVKDIDYDHSHGGAPIPHVHDWVDGDRQPWRAPEPGEIPE
jgi:RHS repeat-associated protein